MLAPQITLPPYLTLRPARPADLQGIADLMIACEISERGASDLTPEDLRADWQREGFDLAQDAWVVTAAAEGGEQIVGYTDLVDRGQHAALNGDGYTHPDFRGQGIATALVQQMERRAAEHLALAPAPLRVRIRCGLSAVDQAGLELMAHEGYTPIRHFYRMHIEMDAPPPAPTFPPGIRLTPMRAGIEQEVYTAVEEAFRDHWGHIAAGFTTWELTNIQVAYFDPELWILAWDGEEIAGMSICRYKDEVGWVQSLGVRRPWRRAGLGLALLYQSFANFYARGTRVVELGVDASNPTGATRLYRRAGMEVAHEYVTCEKELRPGRDPADAAAA
jgi:mycothiol synthase